ncbi:MAG: succinate dehydrogenase, hydrophobic membrane anchor protein [Alphaproteobacteria bacterium]|nr:succinate dehydrogenase, hydrophobic membrane anchor protein [Alphaproteobacteria bacterium]
MEMRSPLGRARGLGSTKNGVAHWWAERVTAVALVPLTLWFVVSVVALVGADYAAYKAWVGMPGNAVLLVLLIVTLFHHTQLGLTVIVEDYVHGEAAKVVSLMAIKFTVVLLGASCVLAVLRVSFGT